MSIAVGSLLTTALGLQALWVVSNVDLNTVKRRMDFEVKCDTNKLSCPACGVDGQGVHNRIKRSWRNLDFFQFVRVGQLRSPTGSIPSASPPARWRTPETKQKASNRAARAFSFRGWQLGCSKGGSSFLACLMVGVDHQKV